MPIYKATITATVLFEAADAVEAARHARKLRDPSELAYEIDEGSDVGLLAVTDVGEILDAEVPDELRKLGNDGTFFNDVLEAK